MRILVLSIAAVGLIFFLVARRRFDLFSVAFFSACFYFIPAAAGFVQMPTADSEPALETPLSDETYLVMAIVLGGILVFGAAASSPPARHRQTEPYRVEGVALVQGVAGLGAFLAFVGLVLDPGTVWSSDKTEVLESLGRIHIAMETCATIAAVGVVRTGRKWPLVLAVPAFVSDVILGFRGTLVLAVIATLVIWLNGLDLPEAFRRHAVRFAMAAVVPLVVFLWWQQLYSPIRIGDWAEARRRATSWASAREALTNAEPFVTQAILEKVVEQGYRVPPEHLLGVFAVSVPLYTEFFERPLSFNDHFQPDLFPKVRRYGLANNFWAEAWAVGGRPMVVVFLALWCGTLWLGCWCLRARSVHLQLVGGVCGSYLAFFIHRNDLLFQAVLERRFVIGYLAVAGVAWVIGRTERWREAAHVRTA